MNESFEFREVTHFTTGAIGEPGQRVFYLQVGDAVDLITVKLEKQQVEALAKFLRGVLDDLPAASEQTKIVPLIEPAQPRWTVGQIAVGVDENEARVVLVIEEVVITDGDEVDDEQLLDAELDGAKIQAHIGVDQAANFVVTSDELMQGGRAPCRLCGQPLDPSGHACPRLN